MPSYMITAKEDASADDVKQLRKEIEKKGGKITHEYNLIKGFAVTFSDDAVSTFESNPLVGNVEKDSEVHTQ